MYGKFRKQYGDQTRVDACFNINSAASFAESISGIFRHSSTAHQDSSASLPRLKLFVQQQGASIPQCENGTNILIPLPGSVSSEDMAVTGAGARLNGADASILSLLYDFEELEGELDFLTRVVVLTFYPAASGRTPLTLGEVEVLGVSLPWKVIFTNESHGARFLERAFARNRIPSCLVLIPVLLVVPRYLVKLCNQRLYRTLHPTIG
ncbi:hypothetical protein SOVF_181580 [Spinacia oleracea]|nr:hypothetical protein SOVF_181580 [Spinacia oleracea]